MATVFDVAAYVLEKVGRPLSAMKLQKVCYYAQAWHLVWDEEPLFRNRIEAWRNGPVIPDLWGLHKGSFQVDRDFIGNAGNSSALSDSEKETIDVILGYYGDKTSQWLSDLTHMEAPWRDARGDTPDGARSGAEITHAAMHEYYSGLAAKTNA